MYTWTDGTYLAHHGIKGQRWGVRRFQNPDGSYTDLGKKRRNAIVTRKTPAMKAIDDGGKKYKNPIDRLKAVTSDCYIPGHSKNDAKRNEETAKLGIKALNQMPDVSDLYVTGDGDPENRAIQSWFLYEDQTIGLGTIADLIANQNYSAKQVSQLVDIVNKAYADSKSDPSRKEQLYENDGLMNKVFVLTYEKPDVCKKFAEICEKIKKAEKVD